MGWVPGVGGEFLCGIGTGTCSGRLMQDPLGWQWTLGQNLNIPRLAGVQLRGRSPSASFVRFTTAKTHAVRPSSSICGSCLQLAVLR